jgi:DNA polymerase I
MNPLDRFDALWHTDFEFRQDSNALPVPISMCAIEQRTGTKIELWRDELLRLRQAPFDTGPNSCMVAYMAAAELSCFLALGWKFPDNVLCLYAETIAAINGDDTVWLLGKKRPSLHEALVLHGLEPRMSDEEKEYWRRAILDNTEYGGLQKGIQDYNRVDVLETLDLIEKMGPAIDLPRALHRGEYMGAVAHMERVGIPVSRRLVERFVDHEDRIKRHYIARDDIFGLYEGTSFREWKLAALADANGWVWRRSEKGRNLAMDYKAWEEQVELHPELASTAKLRNTIAEVRFSDLLNTIGRDERSRCSLRPFQTRTGRNQPSERGKIFLPALPKWTRGVMMPPPGYGMAELDYS